MAEFYSGLSDTTSPIPWWIIAPAFSDAISNIERGHSAPPPETALAIAQALGLQLTDLYDLDISGKPIPQDLKDYLRDIRSQLAGMDEAKRQQIYDLFSRIMDLAAKR